MASDEFSALGHGLRRHSERNSWNKRRARSRSGCISQSTDDWALRLHSCRALSSQPQNYGRSNISNFKSEFDKPHTCHPWSNLFRSFATFVFFAANSNGHDMTRYDTLPLSVLSAPHVNVP